MSQTPRIEIKQSLRLRLTNGLRASIEMLTVDAVALSRQLEEQAAENPSLVLTRPAPKDWLPRWAGLLPGAGRAGSDSHPGAGEQMAGPGPSLMAHVTAEIDRRMKTPQNRAIALALAEALAPTGWLDRPLLAIARQTGYRLAEVEAVLTRLQEIEPVGLFARNLSECLRLQAQEAGLYDQVMKVVLNNLDLLARGEMRRIAQMAAVTETDIARCFRLIRTMNPKPGTAFDPLMAESLREPDLVARRLGNGDWQITLNSAALPELRIAADAGTAETRAAARMLDQMVLARNETLLRVGAEVMRRQRLALDEGPARLLPLTMAEVAQTLGLHESTVSRVVAGTSIDTPRGVWWLRKMFSRALGHESGEEAVSAAALRDMLARRIAAEPADAPLSDEALARALAAASGVAIARRTVAKYRSMLGIPPAHRRRRSAP